MKGLAALLLLTPLAVPAGAATLGLSPSDPDPAPGSELELAVDIDAIEIGCFSFSVEYDALVLEYLGAEEGPLFSGSGVTTFFSDDVDGSGRPQPNSCLLGFGTSVTGPGTIAVLRFAVLDGTPTTVALREVVLRDVDRLALPGIDEPSLELGGTSTGAEAFAVGVRLAAHPNPSSSRASFVLSGRMPQRAGRLDIYDVSGRLVRSIDWPAGASRRSWDGRDLAGHPVANGVYHARLTSGSLRAQTRIVRVR